MRKSTIRIMRKIYLLGTLLCAWMLAACSSSHDEPEVTKNRTVLVYIAADNSLASLAMSDYNEMKEGMLNSACSALNLLVYIDTGSNPRLVELKKSKESVEEKVLVQYENDRNSCGLAETQEVFRTVFDNEAYKADGYGLIYWSHADGWAPYQNPNTRWIGQDKNGTGDCRMNLDDFVTALQSVPHLDFLMIEACFTSTVEVAYALRRAAEYYIACPTEAPGPGAPYDVTVPLMAVAGTGAALKMAETYYDYYESMYDGSVQPTDSHWTAGIALCVLKNAALDHLADATATALQTAQGWDGMAGGDVFDYDQRSDWSGHVGYYDMDQLMRLTVTADAYQAWKSAYQAAISFWKTTPKNYSRVCGLFSMEGTNGVSHYIPSADAPASYTTAYRATEWYQAAGLKALGW